jgi:toxin ParE1/3/4
MPEYRLTPKAEYDDMPDIWEYSFDKFGAAQANKYTDGLWAEFQNLADRSPTSGKIRDDIGGSYRSQFYGSHTIYFKNTNYGVKIVRILGQKMDPTKHL